MIVLILCLSLQIHIIFAQEYSCENESFQCESYLRQSDCPFNQFIEIENDKNLGCCPKCRSGLGFGVYGCNNNNVRRRCAPGLLCENATCILNKKLCSYTYHLSRLQNLPTCEIDGSFSAKQCKGGKVAGRCFCYNEQGERIFGFDWWKNADNMTCACSRHRARLEANGRIDVTLHCARNGNYEKLQCDSGVCWCADPKTGVTLPNTRVVPQGFWNLLPCYKADEMGTKYLRECESAANAQMLIRQKLQKHGTTDVSFNNLQCDYDGSYGKYKIENGIASCMWRDGSRIGSFQVGANLIGQMDCYCARDHKHFEEVGLGLTLSCMGNGNYEKTQGFNGRVFCVDRDGFSVTGYFNSVVGLDCNPYYYYEVKEPLD